MNDRPKISIITPLFKAEKYIGATIESIQKQTYSHYEHIIIDDCSPDNSYAIAEEYAKKDSRIILLRNENNSRVAFTRNRGLSVATGDYILFLDSDDLLVCDAIEVLLSCFRNNTEIKICTAPYQKISDDGLNKFGIIYPPLITNYTSMLKTCTMAPLTTLLHKSVVSSIRFKNIHHEDYLFWLEILHSNNCTCYGYREKPLAYYRLTANSLSRNKFKTFRYQWNIYRNELKLGIIKSGYFFMFYALHGMIKFLK